MQGIISIIAGVGKYKNGKCKGKEGEIIQRFIISCLSLKRSDICIIAGVRKYKEWKMEINRRTREKCKEWKIQVRNLHKCRGWKIQGMKNARNHLHNCRGSKIQGMETGNKQTNTGEMQGMENTSAIRTIPVLFHYRPIHSTSPCSSALDHRP